MRHVFFKTAFVNFPPSSIQRKFASSKRLTIVSSFHRHYGGYPTYVDLQIVRSCVSWRKTAISSYLTSLAHFPVFSSRVSRLHSEKCASFRRLDSPLHFPNKPTYVRHNWLRKWKKYWRKNGKNTPLLNTFIKVDNVTNFVWIFSILLQMSRALRVLKFHVDAREKKMLKRKF